MKYKVISIYDDSMARDALYSLSVNDDVDLSLLEGSVGGRVDGDLELGQHVLGHLDALAEGLVADVGDDLPVAEDRRLRELELAVEDALVQARSVPLLDPVALAVLWDDDYGGVQTSAFCIIKFFQSCG